VYGFYPLDRGVDPVSALLADAGYHCGLVGKRHISPLSQFQFAYQPPMTKEEGRDVERYRSDVRKFLDTRDGTAPFFLLVAFHDPHRPFPTTGVSDGAAAAVARPIDRARVVVPPDLPDLPEVREDFGGYLDAVARLDDCVGAVLAELDARDLAKDTLVIYTSDHGPPLPFAKTTLYDRGLAVPLVVRWPGETPAGTTSDALLELIDVAPTLLQVAGLRPRSDMDGTSIAPLLRGGDSSGRPWLYASQTDHQHLPSTPMRSVRTERYRYVYNFHPEREFQVDALTSPTWLAMVDAAEERPDLARRMDAYLRRETEELYDLEADPTEVVNLARDQAHAAELARLRAIVVDEMDALDDPFLFVHPDATAEQRTRVARSYELYQSRQEIRLENLRLRQLRNDADRDEEGAD
jgi:N-sulfoglucosamine sulfohydrolase